MACLPGQFDFSVRELISPRCSVSLYSILWSAPSNPSARHTQQNKLELTRRGKSHTFKHRLTLLHKSFRYKVVLCLFVFFNTRLFWLTSENDTSWKYIWTNSSRHCTGCCNLLNTYFISAVQILWEHITNNYYFVILLFVDSSLNNLSLRNGD